MENAMSDACPYCRDWNTAHPESPRSACGPCETCGAPGHVAAHPRQPTSVCLCTAHHQALAEGWHFELYHLIYLLLGGLVLLQLWRLFA